MSEDGLRVVVVVARPGAGRDLALRDKLLALADDKYKPRRSALDLGVGYNELGSADEADCVGPRVTEVSLQ